METHLRRAAKLFIALAAGNVGICLLLYFVGNATQLLDFSRGSNELFRGSPVWGIALVVLMGYSLVLVVPLVICGIAMLRMAPWASGVSTLVATFTLLWFPLGTVVGGYALWVLLADETALLFDYAAKSDRSMLKSR